MTADNLEIIRRLLTEGQTDWEAAVQTWNLDEIKVYPRPDEPGAREVYEGADGLAEYAGNWFGQWDSYDFEPVEITDAGDQVFVVLRERGRLEKSGIEVEEEAHHSFKLRDGKVIEWRQYESRKQALEALALAG